MQHPTPCACRPACRTVNTSTLGCGQWLAPVNEAFFCFVADPAGCPSATPAAQYPLLGLPLAGAAFRECSPVVEAAEPPAPGPAPQVLEVYLLFGV
jgi:hypothetical protein